MVLSKADAALEIGLLVLQEGEARPGLPLHIFLQMPSDHINFFAVGWAVLGPLQFQSPGQNTHLTSKAVILGMLAFKTNSTHLHWGMGGDLMAGLLKCPTLGTSSKINSKDAQDINIYNAHSQFSPWQKLCT